MVIIPQWQAFFYHFHLKPYPNHCWILPKTLALIILTSSFNYWNQPRTWQHNLFVWGCVCVFVILTGNQMHHGISSSLETRVSGKVGKNPTCRSFGFCRFPPGSLSRAENYEEDSDKSDDDHSSRTGDNNDDDHRVVIALCLVVDWKTRSSEVKLTNSLTKQTYTNP